MAKVVVLGAGVAGHTAASFLRKWLPGQHDVVVVSPQPTYNWIPSNIWVGVGLMKKQSVVFPLAPIYDKHKIDFQQAKAVCLWPEGHPDKGAKPVVEVEYTGQGRTGQTDLIEYDYLINATGPKLNFGATPGLGPEGNSLSVCTADHAEHASVEFLENIERMKKGERRQFVIGTGHGSCTCEGAAFEYVVNLEFELRAHGVRDKADIVFLTNEYELGDFGVDGLNIRMGGYVTPSKVFTESLFAERGISAVTRAHVKEVAPGSVHVQTLDEEELELPFDFAMLLPPFTGVPMRAKGRSGEDLTAKIFAPNGFMLVDADYEKKPYEDWRPDDWPKIYQSPAYSNLFAAGIAFAPPHPISKVRMNKDGVMVSPAPPRTGMPSAVIGKTVAKNIVQMINGDASPLHSASLAHMGAACVASAGSNPFNGTAASMTMYPIIPDYERFPEYGRDTRYTFGEIGLAGHWIKIILHHMFLHKARMRPGWTMIPE